MNMLNQSEDMISDHFLLLVKIWNYFNIQWKLNELQYTHITQPLKIVMQIYIYQYRCT